MPSKNALILSYSGNGNTQRMARMIDEGMKSSSMNVQVENVETFDTSLLPNYGALLGYL